MSKTANRTVAISITGDITASYPFEAQANTNSPAAISAINLSPGTNTITLPSTTTYNVRAATFVPPTNNSGTITFKGTTSSDTGIEISRVSPTVITFDESNPPVSIVLYAATTVNDCAIYWN